jgi:hypothetical protein
MCGRENYRSACSRRTNDFDPCLSLLAVWGRAPRREGATLRSLHQRHVLVSDPRIAIHPIDEYGCEENKGEGVTPYYEQDGITIYHGDNRELLGEWSGFRSKSFDLLCTDPPYGLGASRARNRGGYGATMQHTGFFAGQLRPPQTDYGDDEDWDDDLAPEVVAQARAVTKYQIIFGGNYYDLGPARCYLVWDGHLASRRLRW